jgi:hypothetical protein
LILQMGRTFHFFGKQLWFKDFISFSIKDIFTSKKFLLPTLLISLKFMTKLKGSLSIQNKTRRDQCTNASILLQGN